MILVPSLAAFNLPSPYLFIPTSIIHTTLTGFSFPSATLPLSHASPKPRKLREQNTLERHKQQLPSSPRPIYPSTHSSSRLISTCYLVTTAHRPSAHLSSRRPPLFSERELEEGEKGGGTDQEATVKQGAGKNRMERAQERMRGEMDTREGKKNGRIMLPLGHMMKLARQHVPSLLMRRMKQGMIMESTSRKG